MAAAAAAAATRSSLLGDLPGTGQSLFGDPMGMDSSFPPRISTSSSSCPCVVQQLLSHKQEVCGLKWSFDDKQLASGGNDNKLFVWDMQMMGDGNLPVCRFSDHTAAVKAVTWSPHQHGLLASGGGTADRHIRFWNTQNGTALNRVDAGSQVCNLIWSKSVNEIVSTHGYSLNQIIVWKYPTMQKLATLTGHTYRVLYLAMSPDGQTIVTGAGDETLRFWGVFPGRRGRDGSRSALSMSALVPLGNEIR
jgi:cell division cycle 20-like protein 1 (cofactor of APC complex)